MNDRPFETFCEMIDSLPPKAVLEAAARERRMLEEDLSSGRTPPNGDTASILDFCRFLEGAVRGSFVLPDTMLMEHWAFYGKTVRRLAGAEELPRKLKEDIEAAFRDVFCRIMD
jgi:hypothetical protein